MTQYLPLRIIGVEAEDLAKPRDPHWKDAPARPDWLRIRLQTSDSFGKIKGMMGQLKLHTV